MSTIADVRPAFVCERCTRRFDARIARWRCDCTGLLIADCGTPTASSPADGSEAGSWWRYRDALPLLAGETPVTLGDPVSPLSTIQVGALAIHAKLDFLGPTGSFKDRNASLIATRLAHWGVRSCVVDSSGNAGIACAAYFARAGIKCRVFVPAYTHRGKLALIASYGADVVTVGTRDEATAATLEAARETFYGGQTHSPFFTVGGLLWAHEVVDQLGRAPDAVVVPVGSGSLLLGAARGFERLVRAGRIGRMPRLYGVQAAACAPVAAAFDPALARGPWTVTLAEGVATSRPLRLRGLLAAVRASGGGMVVVTETAIAQAGARLASQGLCVEPTGGVAMAGIDVLLARGLIATTDTVVLSLTGSGQKMVVFAA